MTDKMFKLSDKYANLLIEVWETQIKVVDSSRPNSRVTMFYGDLLNQGMMVYHKSRLWFFSKITNVGILHGVWTNEDGETKNTAAISNRLYGELLNPGTVVMFNNHSYFYSCPFGMMNLEGAWTDEELVSYSVHEFLGKVIDDDCPVEVVLEG